MTWQRPSITTIYERIKADMESRITDGIRIPKVSLLGILNIVFSGAAHLTYGYLAWMYKQFFVDTATEEGLERWGNIYRLPNKAATYTTGVVYFTGTTGKVVLAGTTFSNSEGYEYETDADYTITTVPTSVACTALNEGALYNSEDTTMTLSNPDADIDSDVIVVSGFDDGTDIESLEDWALRLLQRTQNPPSSGNVEDYVRWAREIEGVGKAWCFGAEDWLGSGTVGVVVSTATLGQVGASVLSDVETYIEAEKPIPANVSYSDVTPTGVVFDISVTPNTSDMKDAIDESLTDHFILSSVPGGETLISQLRSAIAAAGPDDYDITALTVGGTPVPVDNFSVTMPEVAFFSSANYSTLT